jgi:hypothetical protein
MSCENYRFIVDGELGVRYANAFEGMTISAHDGMTEITGAVIDQSHLQGLLERIGGLGLRLRSVTVVDAENDSQPHMPMPGPRHGPALTRRDSEQ